jgi:hypothetical protein
LGAKTSGLAAIGLGRKGAAVNPAFVVREFLIAYQAARRWYFQVRILELKIRWWFISGVWFNY